MVILYTRDLHVGDPVNYHAIIGEGVTSTGHTIKRIDPIPSSNGKPVAWITGKPGCVSIDALSPAPSEDKHD